MVRFIYFYKVIQRLVKHAQAVNAAFRHVDGEGTTALPEDALSTMRSLLPTLEVFHNVAMALGQESKCTMSQVVFFMSVLCEACKALEGDEPLVSAFKLSLLDGLNAVRIKFSWSTRHTCSSHGCFAVVA